ncbi:MAG: hypothetical protein ACLFM0_00655 [Spirochaetales bacterium]
MRGTTAFGLRSRVVGCVAAACLAAGCTSVHRSDVSALADDRLRVFAEAGAADASVTIRHIDASVESDHLAAAPAYDPRLLAHMAVHEAAGGRLRIHTASRHDPPERSRPRSEVQSDPAEDSPGAFSLTVDVREQSFLRGIHERRAITAVAELVASGENAARGAAFARAVYRADHSDTVISPGVYYRVVSETVEALFGAIEQRLEEE